MKVGAILPAADSDGGGRTPTWDEVRDEAFGYPADRRASRFEVRPPGDESGERAVVGEPDDLAPAFDGYRGAGVGHPILEIDPKTEASLDAVAAAITKVGR